jgi:hypothetical protein
VPSANSSVYIQPTVDFTNTLQIQPTFDNDIHLFEASANAISLGVPGGSQISIGGPNSPNANITVQSNGSTWTFGTDGALTLPAHGAILGTTGIGLQSTVDGNTSGLYATGNITEGGNTYLFATNDVYIRANNDDTNRDWVFGTNGDLTLPGSIVGTGNLHLQPDPANTGSYLDIFLTNGPDLHLVASAGANLILGKDDGANVMTSWNGNVYIQSWTRDFPTHVGGIWTFGGDGSTVFPTLTTQRGDNPSGTIQGQTLLFGDNSQEAVISTPDGNVTYPNSQRLVINPGKGADGTSGEGGDIYLWAGRGGDVDGNGGDVKIRGGQGVGNGPGGYLRIEAGDTQGNGTPGYIDITGGVGGNTVGGYVNVTGGQGATVGGDVKIYGGYGQATGGNVNIWGGASGNGQANEGHVNIQTGGNTWIFGADGELTTPQGGRLGSAGKGWQGLDGGYGNPVSFTSLYANGFYAGCLTASPDGNLTISTYTGDGQQGLWSFDNTGNLSASGNVSAVGNITGAYLFGNGSQLTGVGAASVPSQNILPTIQSIIISNTSSEYETSGGSGYANVLVANVAPVIEYGVIVTAGSTVDKYVAGNLANIPGTEQITISTGTSDQPFTVYAYVTTNAGTYYSGPEVGFSGLCLLKGTMISLADGTYKPIEDIDNDDLLLTWDFDLGRYAQARPLWIKRGETGTRYNQLTFSDGTILRTFDQHRIFNKQAGAFTYPMSDDTPVGTITVNEHGQEITLVKRDLVWDTIEHYNIITNHHINLFADSVLTSCRFNNIYPITNMKFVKGVVLNRNLSEFAEIESRFVSGLRLQEQSFELAMIEGYVNRLLATEAMELISV